MEVIAVSVLQVWLLVGIPVLAIAVALFAAPSPGRKLLGYLVLAVGFAVLAVVDGASGAVFGAILALLYAAGQGLPPRPDGKGAGPASPAP